MGRYTEVALPNAVNSSLSWSKYLSGDDNDLRIATQMKKEFRIIRLLNISQ